MTLVTWKELALVDAELTNALIDNEEVHSHKVLDPGHSRTLNTTLHAMLEKEYEETLLNFEIKPVHYLPEQKFTNLGVFAKSDIEANSELSLRGVMAEIEEFEQLPDDANVSVFQRNGAELMLGPLSFVNHSCWPNSLYVKSHGNSFSTDIAFYPERRRNHCEVRPEVFRWIQRRLPLPTCRVPWRRNASTK